MCSHSHTVPQSPCNLPGLVSPRKSWQQAAATPAHPGWRVQQLMHVTPDTWALPEVGVDVNVVHALHSADVAATARRHVAVDAVEVHIVRVVQLPPLADPGLLH